MTPMAVKGPSNESFSTDLKGVFDTLQDETVTSLAQVHELQLAARALMNLEASRLARKLGGDAPRVRALKAQAAGRVELVRAIDVEAQVAAVRVPRVEKADTLLHGRITDQALNRVAGVTVQLVDAKGEPVPGVKAASTDAQGYYAFVLKPEQAAALADRQLAVAIANDDQTVKPTQAAVSLATGTTFLHELKLSNDELSRLKLRPSKAPDLGPRRSAGAKRARGGKGKAK
jgi:hypothetical protein